MLRATRFDYSTLTDSNPWGGADSVRFFTEPDLVYAFSYNRSMGYFGLQVLDSTHPEPDWQCVVFSQGNVAEEWQWEVEGRLAHKNKSFRECYVDSGYGGESERYDCLAYWIDHPKQFIEMCGDAGLISDLVSPRPRYHREPGLA